jgi:hypothetical protein
MWNRTQRRSSATPSSRTGAPSLAAKPSRSKDQQERSASLLVPVLALIGLLLGSAALADSPAITQELPGEWVRGANASVSVQLEPATVWSSVRVYFRAVDGEQPYFIEMRSAGGGRYWAALPKPSAGTAAVETYIVATDARGIPSRTEPAVIPVVDAGRAELATEHAAFAAHLVIGETTPAQQGARVSGFECEGIVSRLNADGMLRLDEACRREQLAAGKGAKRALIPLAAVGAVGGAWAALEGGEKTSGSPDRP